MGNKQSLRRQRHGLDPDLAEAILTRALFEALLEDSPEEREQLETMKQHAWNPVDHSPPFVLLRDELTARRTPSPLTSDCIRGKKGYRQGIHVFEIQWERDERGTFAIVGVATPKAPLTAKGFTPVVGNNTESWGWDIVHRKLYHGGEIKGEYPGGLAMILGFQVPDTFYIILDMNESTLSFATKELHLGVAFTQLPQQPDMPMCLVANAIFGNCDIRMRYLGSGENILSGLKHPFALNQSVSEQHPKPSSEPDDSASRRRRSTGSPSLGSEADIMTASSRYKFDYIRGDNASVMCAGKRAKRNKALNSFSDGIVMTSEPLVDNELFEVRLDSKVHRWVGCLLIGAIPKDPNSFSFPRTFSEYNKELFMWCGKKIFYGKSMEHVVKHNIIDITTGDRVGVMRKSDDTLHFFLNGSVVGKCFGKTPKTLYGVVDIYGQAEEITITGGEAETQSSNNTDKDQNLNNVDSMVKMKNAIDLLKSPVNPGLPLIITKLAEDVYQPYVDYTDPSIRQKYGDHLVDIGAAQHLAKLLHRLDDTGIETKEGWIGMNIVRSILWNYSDASLAMAKAIGQSGLLERFVNDLKRIGPVTIKNEKKAYIVSSAVNILHNCAKATENRQVFRDIKAVDVLVPFLEAEKFSTVISALLTLSYITDDTQIDLLKTNLKTISTIRGMLSNACSDPDLHGTDGDCRWSALEIVTGIANIAVNQSNCEMILDSDVIPLLFDVIEKGGAIEKESACNALWVISSSENGKRMIRGHSGADATLKRLSKDSNKNIASSAERVLLRIKQQPMQQGAGPARGPRKDCEYMQACRVFLKSLDLSDYYFDPRHDKCYCTKCHASRNEKLFYTQGEPAKDYALPIGWTRFALKIRPAALDLQANSKWHVAYHGTAHSSVKSILKCDGQLLIPGDTALDGKKIAEVDGHLNDDNKPENFNTKQIFVSPSIRYSGLNVYAKTESFVHPNTKKSYKAKVAFQLWIEPGCYKVGPETVEAKYEIDPKFSNQEIEWSTVHRGAVHLYGILVQLEE